ncbi:MAG: hypothetical protein ACTSUE_20445 [Promethearchaeota archaeon]
MSKRKTKMRNAQEQSEIAAAIVHSSYEGGRNGLRMPMGKRRGNRGKGNGALEFQLAFVEALKRNTITDEDLMALEAMILGLSGVFHPTECFFLFGQALSALSYEDMVEFVTSVKEDLGELAHIDLKRVLKRQTNITLDLIMELLEFYLVLEPKIRGLSVTIHERLSHAIHVEKNVRLKRKFRKEDFKTLVNRYAKIEERVKDGRIVVIRGDGGKVTLKKAG